MSVVLRCPNCGTSQAALGECDACHESAVRAFCTNHTPGRWLDGPACDACGARLGDAAAPTAPPRAPAPRPTATRPPRASRPPEPLPPAAPPRTTRREVPVGPGRRTPRAPEPPPFDPGPRRDPFDAVDPFDTRDTYADDAPLPRRGPGGIPGFPGLPGFPGFPGRRGPVRVDLPPGLPDAVRAGTRSAAGCFVRAVLTLVALAALLAAGLFGLFGFSSGARTWVVDLGQQAGVVEGVPEQTERGVAAYRAGDRALAERELAEAARAYPRSAVAPLYLARLRLDAGDDYRAGEQLSEALRREPASPLVRRAVAEYGCAMLGRDAGNARAAQLVARVGAPCTALGGDAGTPPALTP